MSSHLSLEELTAYVNGVPLPSAAEAHLSLCANCQQEIRRWRSVADGVQLVGSSPPLPGTLSTVPRPRRSYGLAAALASAAAVVLIGSATSALNLAAGEGTAADPAAAPTTPTHCPNRQVIVGEIQSTSGTTAVVKLARTSGLVTVTTSATTRISRQDPASLADLRKGIGVAVISLSSKAAIRVAILEAPVAIVRPRPTGTGKARPSVVSGPLVGTITAVDASGFTLGTGERVKTAKSTTVVKHVSSRVTELRTGRTVSAAGAFNSDGTFAATVIHQGTLPVPPELSGVRSPGLPAAPSLRKAVPPPARPPALPPARSSALPSVPRSPVRPPVPSPSRITVPTPTRAPMSEPTLTARLAPTASPQLKDPLPPHKARPDAFPCVKPSAGRD